MFTRGLGVLFCDDVMTYFGYDLLYLTMVMCHVCSMMSVIRCLVVLSVRICLRERFIQDRRSQHKQKYGPKSMIKMRIYYLKYNACNACKNTLGVPVYKGISGST